MSINGLNDLSREDEERYAKMFSKVKVKSIKKYDIPYSFDCPEEAEAYFLERLKNETDWRMRIRWENGYVRAREGLTDISLDDQLEYIDIHSVRLAYSDYYVRGREFFENGDFKVIYGDKKVRHLYSNYASAETDATYFGLCSTSGNLFLEISESKNHFRRDELLKLVPFKGSDEDFKEYLRYKAHFEKDGDERLERVCKEKANDEDRVLLVAADARTGRSDVNR